MQVVSVVTEARLILGYNELTLRKYHDILLANKELE